MTAPTPTWTQADADNLRAVISLGTQTVTYSGPPARTVVYQSLAEMRALLAEMVIQLKNAAGQRSNYRLARFRSGV